MLLRYKSLAGPGFHARVGAPVCAGLAATLLAGSAALNGSGVYAWSFTGTWTQTPVCVAVNVQANPQHFLPSVYSPGGGSYTTVTWTDPSGSSASGQSMVWHCIMTK